MSRFFSIKAFLQGGLSVMLSVGSLCLFAQKGLPSEEPTSASVHTNYPKHVDFRENMLSKIHVPEGFTVSVAASGLGKPRMMAFNDRGQLYVTRRDQNDVLMLTDTDHDGKFDQLATVVTEFTDVHGIAIRENMLYLCSSKKLCRGAIQPDGKPARMDTLISDLPDGGQHDNRTIAFGPDGSLYITVGSNCNDCKETNPENATILRCNPDGSGRKIFARGLRNTIGIDWQPQTKELWGFDNGMDWRGDSIPPEELNRIVENGNYGWPQVFGRQQVDETREDPAGTTKKAYAATTVPSVMDFPAHSAPIDMKFMDKGVGWPDRYKNDALVCWHGSWNRQHPEGYKVQRVHFEQGMPVNSEDFFAGFFDPLSNTRFGRPAGLAFSDSGRLYISDDEGGIIYCVTYKK